jgi:hypothetical protein
MRHFPDGRPRFVRSCEKTALAAVILRDAGYVNSGFGMQSRRDGVKGWTAM